MGRFIGCRHTEDLARIDPARVADLVAIRGKDRRVDDAAAVAVSGDGPEAIPRLHHGLARLQHMGQVGACEGHLAARNDLAARRQLVRAQLIDARRQVRARRQRPGAMVIRECITHDVVIHIEADGPVRLGMAGEADSALIVILHDIKPNRPRMTARRRQKQTWRLIALCQNHHRP